MSDIITQNTPAWMEQRRGHVTASRCADILAKTKTGVSVSRQNYLIELAVQRVTGVIEEGYKNEAMLHGTTQEPLARQAYELLTQTFVEEVSFVKHKTIEWYGASPDGVIHIEKTEGKIGLVEIKNPFSSAVHWSYIKADEPPTKYKIQMMAQMSCTGAEWVDFFSYDERFPVGSKHFLKRMIRDQVFIDDMESEIKTFLEEVAHETKLMENRV
jgi:putative phage-type endonuclease